jgi:hypothetical protein
LLQGAHGENDIYGMRLDFWAEKNGILSPNTQYGFRKRKGTRDCLAMLTTDISTSFEMNKQTEAAFLDISGACDNVLINVLCGVMLGKKLLLGIVVFCVGVAECMTFTGYNPRVQFSAHFCNIFL